jgi:hypothetical protein
VIAFEGCFEEIEYGPNLEARNIPADGSILGPFAVASKGRLGSAFPGGEPVLCIKNGHAGAVSFFHLEAELR